MTWTPRNTRRWGDQRTIVVPTLVAPVAVAFSLETQDTVRVEAPNPCTWSVFGSIDGVPLSDLAFAQFEVLISMGVGSLNRLNVNLPVVPPFFALQLLPAHYLVARMRVTFPAGTPAVAGGNYVFSTWAAPTNPWEGARVEGTDDGQ